MRSVKFVAILVSVALASAVCGQAPAAPAPQTPAPQPTGPETFQGALANQGGPGSRAFLGGWFTLKLDRYTTDEEAKALALALKEGGDKGLLDAVWNLKQIGFLKVEGSNGFPIFAARSTRTPAGRMVRCLTNRRIAPREVNFDTRSMDYPFGYIEMFLPDEGKGSGQIIGAAQLGFTAANTVTVESFGTMPVRITEVSLEQKKKK